MIDQHEEARAYCGEIFWEYLIADINAATCVKMMADLGVEASEDEVVSARMRGHSVAAVQDGKTIRIAKHMDRCGCLTCADKVHPASAF